MSPTRLIVFLGWKLERLFNGGIYTAVLCAAAAAAETAVSDIIAE